jgi:hypothetical protein
MDYFNNTTDDKEDQDSEETSLVEANAKLKQLLRDQQREHENYVQSQNQQADTYMNQIENLKAQIQLFEQKFE